MEQNENWSSIQALRVVCEKRHGFYTNDSSRNYQEQSPQSSKQTIIDLPYLPSGMYLLKVTHEDNTIQFKKIALHL
ncbi:T9SS type A sorting domain-containing protein [Flavobacteriales bacterium]|nr:T9SS type A sorting domain-containing protein [Flavobacteriales bacterium]